MQQRSVMTIIGNACVLAILATAQNASADAGDILHEYGTSYSVGAGFVQFTHPSMREHATEGVGWEVRLAFGTKKGLAVEVGYLGTLHDLDATGLDARAKLIGSSLETVLKIPFASGPLQPYALFGAGVARYRIANTVTTTSEMKSVDSITSYPFGGGLVFRQGEMVIDLRAAYRVSGHVDLLPVADTRLDAWSATLTLGVGF